VFKSVSDWTGEIKFTYVCFRNVNPLEKKLILCIFYRNTADMCCISANLLTPGTLILQVMAVVLIQFGRHRAVRSTGVLFIYWILQFVSAVLALQTHARAVAAGVTNRADYRIRFFEDLFIIFSSGRGVKYCGDHICMYVCFLAFLKTIFLYFMNIGY